MEGRLVTADTAGTVDTFHLLDIRQKYSVGFVGIYNAYHRVIESVIFGLVSFYWLSAAISKSGVLKLVHIGDINQPMWRNAHLC